MKGVEIVKVDESRRDVKKRNRGRPRRFMDVVKDW